MISLEDWGMKSEMVMQNCNNIPKHWQIKKLGEIVSVLGDGLHGTPKYSDTGDYFFINGNNLFDGRIVIRENTKRVALKEYEKYKKQLNDRTILVSINGTIGNIAFYNKEKVILGKSACYFNLLDSVDKKYIRLVLSGQGFINYALKVATGSTIKNVSLKSMREFEIPLPPLPEQQAIVAKIEELLSDLENGKQQLLTAQQQLKIYRQSLLKAAFECAELLPFEQFIESSQNGLSKRTGIKGQEYKVLRLADISNNMIDGSNPRKIVMDSNEVDKYKIKTDDLLCIRVNGSKDLVGKLVHVSRKNEEDNWAFCDHFIRFRLDSQKAFAKFFHFYFSTVNVRKYIHDNMVTSAGQNTVSQGTIKNILVPNYTRREQELIVEELESKLTVCDKIEETITQSLQQAEMLKQSILKRAFEGKLV